MWLFSTPHRRALWIVWIAFSAWTAVAIVALGRDWFIPVLWPAAFVRYLLFLIVRWERRIFRIARDLPLEDQQVANSPNPPRMVD